MCWLRLDNWAWSDLSADLSRIQGWEHIVEEVFDPISVHVRSACTGSPVLDVMAGEVGTRVSEAMTDYETARSQVVQACGGEPQYWYRWRYSYLAVDEVYRHGDTGTVCPNPFGYANPPGPNYVR